MIEILYFAWLRQKIGKSSEKMTLPKNITNAGELMQYLAGLSPEYADAFENPDAIKIARNQNHIDADMLLKDGDEIAFFPPVTGG